MRNPFARLARPDTARPSLRERAAALKASASRVIRRKPVDALPPATPGEWLANSPTPALMALVDEWCALEAEMAARPMADDELDVKGTRQAELHGLICAFEARCFEDLRLKTVIYQDEAREAQGPVGDATTMAVTAWLSVVRDIEAVGNKMPIKGLGVFDPIFDAIEEGRRLIRLASDVYARPTAPTREGVLQNEEDGAEALRDLWKHLDATVFKTVPRTAGGCRELARFAEEYSASQGVPISDDETLIVGLIAQSPLL
jgi:hypothetical protein